MTIKYLEATFEPSERSGEKVTLTEWLESLKATGSRDGQAAPVVSSFHAAETPLAQLYRALDEIKRNVKTTISNPRERAYQIDQDVERFNALPEDEKTQKIVEAVGGMGVIGKASKAAPYKQAMFDKLLRQGRTPEQAYPQVGGIPLLNYKGEVADIGVPLMRKDVRSGPAVMEHAREALHSPEATRTVKFRDLYNPKDIEAIERYAPEVAETPVILRAKGTGGSYDPITKQITIQGTSPSQIAAIGAHEGTHRYQHAENLPFGASPEQMKELRMDAKREIQKMAENIAPSDEAYERLQYALQREVSPGMNPKELELLQGDMKELARWLSWNKRLTSQRSDPDYTLYRSIHGEQVAEAARRHAQGKPLEYTTPLAKHITDPESIYGTDYINRLQHLYDLKQQGVFDPYLQPYSLPPGKR